MKNFKKLCALALALLMAATCLLTACGDVDGSDETTPAVTNADNSDTTPAETEYNALDHVTTKDLGGETYSMLIPIHDWAICNLTADEISGDVIQDTIYSRQMQVEDLLNCKLTETKDSTVATTVKSRAGESASDSYCIALVPTYDALSLYTNGYVVDQTTISTINFENPWWEESFNSSVNMGKARYISFSNASLIYYSSFYIFCFNKEMISDRSLENPYDLVESGDWTWDKAYEMMKTAAVDEGGDGVFLPGVDTLGLTGHINHSRNIRFSCGYTICETDDDGGLTYNGLSDKYIESFTKYTEYFINSPYVAIAGASSNKYSSYTPETGIKNYVSVFKEGKSLFLTTGTNEVMQIRDMDIEYGIVCVPKYSKDQENYSTPVYSATAGFIIPKIGSEAEIETSGMILEVLGATSYNNLVDKHISLVLHSRAAQDATAVENINLAYASGAIDTAMANNFGSCTNILNNLDSAGLTSVASLFKSIETKLKKDIAAAETAVGLD